MDTSNLLAKFAGWARLKVARPSGPPFRPDPGVISLDVRDDRKGEFFEIARQPGVDPEVAVLDVQPADRHLLLLVREGGEKQKFLCGHDERHWFVAAIPETAPVGTVRRPRRRSSPPRSRPPRPGRGSGPRPATAARTPPTAARASGSSSRSPASPWTRSWSCATSRSPGQRRQAALGRVLLPDGRRDGLRLLPAPQRRHRGAVPRQILAGSPKAKGVGLAGHAAESGVYVRGRVRHADHETITLHGWHRVLIVTLAP